MSIQTSLKPAWTALFGVCHENRLHIVLLCSCNWVTKSTGYRTIHNMLPKYITLQSLFNATEFSNCPTRCDLFSLLHFCRQLHMFRVLTPIIRGWYNCNYSFWYWLTGSTTIRSRCWVGTDSCAPYGSNTYRTIHMNQYSEAVITVVRAPDDGCQHPKHVELPTEM